MADLNVEQIAAILKRIESGGGKNYNHATIDRGPDKGKKAAGDYGFTPSTINEVVLKHHPDLYPLTQLKWEDRKAWVEAHPNVQHQLAVSLITDLKNRGLNDEQIGFAWNHGTGLGPHHITPEVMQHDEYTNNYRKLKDRILGVKGNSYGLDQYANKDQLSVAPSAPTSQLGQDITDYVSKVAEKIHPQAKEAGDMDSYFKNIVNKIKQGSPQTQNSPQIQPSEQLADNTSIPTELFDDKEDEENL